MSEGPFCTDECRYFHIRAVGSCCEVTTDTGVGVNGRLVLPTWHDQKQRPFCWRPGGPEIRVREAMPYE